MPTPLKWQSLCVSTLVLTIAACGDSVTLSDDITLTPTQVTSTGTPGWRLDDSLEVRLTNFGTPLPNALVTWSTGAEGAVLLTDTSRTDADGRARAAFSPGWIAGTQQVIASARGATVTIDVPVATMALTQVAMLFNHLCGLDPEGRMWCWQRYRASREPFAEPTTDVVVPDAQRPEPVATDLRFAVLRGNERIHLFNTPVTPEGLCALTQAGELWCASDADFTASDGKLPILRKVDAPVPFTDVVIGGWGTDQFMCGLDASHFAWCRGQGDRGQLGDGSASDHADWQRAAGDVPFLELAAGEWSVCGLDLSGRPWCWGFPAGTGRLGVSTAASMITVPTAIDADIRLRTIRRAAQGFCGITLHGGDQLLCWGGLVIVDRPVGSPPEGNLTATGLTGYPATATDLDGEEEGGYFISDGRIYQFGYGGGSQIADLELRPDNGEVMGLTTAQGFVSRNSPYWCVTVEGGGVVCGWTFARPMGVPLPAP